jgi:hypothetical protein
MGGNRETWCGPNRLVLERRTWPVFSLPIFLKEFLLQTFYPLTLPFFLSKYVKGTSQFFFGGGVFFVVQHNIIHPMSWVSIWTSVCVCFDFGCAFQFQQFLLFICTKSLIAIPMHFPQAILIWFIARHDELTSAGINLSEVLSCWLAMLALRACVATKYGFLSDKE